MASLSRVCQRTRSLLPSIAILVIVVIILHLVTHGSVVDDVDRRDGKDHKSWKNEASVHRQTDIIDSSKSGLVRRNEDISNPDRAPENVKGIDDDGDDVINDYCTECGETPVLVGDANRTSVLSGLFEDRGSQRVSTAGERWPKGFPASCYKFGTKFKHEQRHVLPTRTLLDLRCTKRFPGAFIIGVKKGGTQTLTRFVDLHPAIVRQPWSLRWSSDINDDPSAMKKRILREMPYTTRGQIIVSNYPGFLVTHRRLFRKITNKLSIQKNVKLIVILRSPVKRAISDYTHAVARLSVSGIDVYNNDSVRTQHRGDDIAASFADTVIDRDTGRVKATSKIVSRGHYITYLSHLYQAFHRDQVLVLDGSIFSERPADVLQTVEKFIDVPPFFTDSSFVFEEDKGFFCANVSFRPDLTCMPSAKGRTHSDVDQDVIDKLTEYYRPYNINLASFLRSKGYEPFPWLYE